MPKTPNASQVNSYTLGLEAALLGRALATNPYRDGPENLKLHVRTHLLSEFWITGWIVQTFNLDGKETPL